MASQRIPPPSSSEKGGREDEEGGGISPDVSRESERKPSPGNDVEVVGLISQTLQEAGARSHHPAGIAPL